MLSIIVICHAVGICFHEKIGWLPWGITSAMIALVYFALGVWARPFVRKIEGFKSWIFFVAGISLIVVQYIVLPFTGADLGGAKVFLSTIIYSYFCFRYRGMVNDSKGYTEKYFA